MLGGASQGRGAPFSFVHEIRRHSSRGLDLVPVIAALSVSVFDKNYPAEC